MSAAVKTQNETRDKALKLNLYARRGVQEYWILDWRARQVLVHRRHDGGLRVEATLFAEDTLISPLLPGFAVTVGDFFADIPGGQ